MLIWFSLWLALTCDVVYTDEIVVVVVVVRCRRRNAILVSI